MKITIYGDFNHANSFRNCMETFELGPYAHTLKVKSQFYAFRFGRHKRQFHGDDYRCGEAYKSVMIAMGACALNHVCSFVAIQADHFRLFSATCSNSGFVRMGPRFPLHF